MRINKKNWNRLAVTLGLIQLFIGLGGIAGGLPMVLDPTGAAIGLNQDILADTPFENFLIPGIVILTFNGIFISIAGIASIKKYQRAGEIGVIFGIWLTGFMIAEILWLHLVMWLQHLFLICGIIEIILGAILYKSRK